MADELLTNFDHMNPDQTAPDLGPYCLQYIDFQKVATDDRAARRQLS